MNNSGSILELIVSIAVAKADNFSLSATGILQSKTAEYLIEDDLHHMFKVTPLGMDTVCCITDAQQATEFRLQAARSIANFDLTKIIKDNPDIDYRHVEGLRAFKHICTSAKYTTKEDVIDFLNTIIDDIESLDNVHVDLYKRLVERICKRRRILAPYLGKYGSIPEGVLNG